MPRPTNKQELIEQSEENFEKLFSLLDEKENE